MSQLLQVALRGDNALVADGVLAPALHSQGLPFDGLSVLAIDTVSAIDRYCQGLPFTAAGRLATSVSAPSAWVSGTMPVDATGRLCVLSGLVDRYATGVPFSATGQIAATSALGPEIIRNGSFDADTTFWVLNSSTYNAGGWVQLAPASTSNLNQTVSTGPVVPVEGATYLIEFDYENQTGGLQVRYGAVVNDTLTDAGTGRYSGSFVWPAAATVINLRAVTGGYDKIDNVTLKEVL